MRKVLWAMAFVIATTSVSEAQTVSFTSGGGAVSIDASAPWEGADLFQRLRPFMKAGPMNSPKEYADRIRACEESKIYNLTCEEFLNSFNREFKEVAGIGAMESIEELAKFFEEETAIVACGTGRAIIAGVNSARKVEYIERPFAFGEMCFQHIATGVKVSSAGCGQWIRQILHPTFTTERVEKLNSGIVDQAKGAAAGVELERVSRTGNSDDGKFLGMSKKAWVTTGIVAGVAGLAIAALVPRAQATATVTVGGYQMSR